MAGDLTLYEVRDRVATLTLNDPERRNALGDEMIEAVVAALERFRADEGAAVLIVTGAGNAFCSGGDLKMMERWGGKGEGGAPSFDPIAQRDRYRFGIQQIPLTFAKIEKPVMAAVNGPAVGAGCDLALMADIRIASDRAKFGEIFSRVGLAPGDGGAFFLPRIVGVEKACELIFTGDIIDAAEAERIGLVGRVVPDADLMTEARALALRIASGPLQAHRMAKFAIYRGLNQTLEESLQTMALMQSMLHGTKDHEEGVRAFLEKRPPRCEGR
jgi:enoyl-CoA hydratase/carnithine racemase